MKQVLDYTGSQNRMENFFRDLPDEPDEFSATWGSRVEQLKPVRKSKPGITLKTGLEELGCLRRLFALIVSRLGFAVSPVACSTTFGLLSATPGEINKDYWDMKNQRRLYLIDKKYASGLSDAEAGELEHLQAEMSTYLDATAPLPFETLEHLEAIAKQLEEKDQAQNSQDSP